VNAPQPIGTRTSRGQRAAEAAALDAMLLDFMSSAPAGFVRSGATDAERYGVDAARAAAWDARFEALALALYEHQMRYVEAYRAYVRARRAPAPRRACEVPALPVEAFKQTRVASFPPHETRLEFRTSGTSAARAGILPLDSHTLYDVALERGFRHHVMPDRDRMLVLVLAPPVEEAPHSSLAYMLDRVRKIWGTAGSAHFVRAGEVEWRALAAALRHACDAGEPACLLGTAFAWVQVLDRCDAEGFRVRLPGGSRLLETGGYKGRSRELAPDALYREIESTLGIPTTHIVSEYGMTELGSQYYTTSLRGALTGETLAPRAWSHPAWLRPRLFDAEAGVPSDAERFQGTGLLAHHDLANRGSVAHLLTADLGRSTGTSFELLGRAPRTTARGCGLPYEASP